MAIYVEVSKLTPNEVYDDKIKSDIAAFATSTVQSVVGKSSKLTDEKPTDKGAKGWFVLGNVSVGPDKAGTKFVGKVELTVAVWPSKSIKAMPSGTGAFGIEKGEKVSLSDAKQVVKKAAEEAAKTAVSFMESKKPE
jgi:hypothetical protein